MEVSGAAEVSPVERVLILYPLPSASSRLLARILQPSQRRPTGIASCMLQPRSYLEYPARCSRFRSSRKAKEYRPWIYYHDHRSSYAGLVAKP
jgi:hypothetical protein